MFTTKRATIVCFLKKILQGACADVFTRPILGHIVAVPCKQTQHCCATLRWSQNNRNVGTCWAKSLTGFKLAVRNKCQQVPTLLWFRPCKRTQQVTTLLGPTMLGVVGQQCMGLERNVHILFCRYIWAELSLLFWTFLSGTFFPWWGGARAPSKPPPPPRTRLNNLKIYMSRSFPILPHTRFFFIGASKFWPSLVLLKFLHDLSLDCS